MTDYVHPAVGVILKQLQELHLIITGIRTFEDHLPAGKLFDRWKKRTKELLRTSVNAEDAKEFSEIFESFSYGEDAVEKLRNHAIECQAYLEALVVELGRHGETISSSEAESFRDQLSGVPDDSERNASTAVIGVLLARGLNLSEILNSGDRLDFQLEYQDWYTRSLEFIKALIPSRLKEFERQNQRGAGEELTIDTYSISDYLMGFTLSRGNKTFNWNQVARARMVQQISILGAARRLLEEKGRQVPAEDESVKRRRVFVVHGRDERLRKGMFAYLRAIGLDPIEWGKAVALTGKASPYIGEVLDAAFKHAQAVVALLTPDDEARLRLEYVGFGRSSI